VLEKALGMIEKANVCFSHIIPYLGKLAGEKINEDCGRLQVIDCWEISIDE